MRHLDQAVIIAALLLSACSLDSDRSKGAVSQKSSDIGCADGEREGFTSIALYPHIAGCSGGWSTPGIHTHDPGFAPACPGVTTTDTTIATCGHSAGDDGVNTPGEDCTVADLCAPGWHVCTGAAEVAEASATGCAGATDPGAPPLFFATRQSSNGCGVCATGTSTAPACNSATCVAGCLQTEATSNDVFGCGNLGLATPSPDCGPLDRFSNNLCAGLPAASWSCNLPTSSDNNGLCEAYTVKKSNSDYGGVLCCRDPNEPPDCSGAVADPSSLWPPNHRMASVGIANVVDPDPGDSVTVTVTAIFQDEPLDTIGDGHTEVDGTGVGAATAAVRAERTGAKNVPGDGRVYHIDFAATDSQGASCTGTVTVCVPHDQGQGSTCVDGGPLYDSTVP